MPEVGTVEVSPAPPPRPPFPPPSARPVVAGEVPPRLFVYWSGHTIPEFAAACLAALRRTNPAWNMTILGPDNVKALGLDPPPKPSSGAEDPAAAQHTADWYRAEVLAKYGGVYMDASNLNFLPLENWVNMSSPAVQGFNRPANTRFVSEGELAVMENWAIAAPLESQFMSRWRDTFAGALSEGTDAFVLRQDPNVVKSLNCGGEHPGYLAQHVCWVLTRNALGQDVAPTRVLSSTDVGRPFHFMLEDNWVSCWVAQNTLKAYRDTYGGETAFLKFRGAERACVSPLWMYSAFSFWPFADPSRPNIARWLREELEAEPDLLARSTTDTDAKSVGLFILQWWVPLLLIMLLLNSVCCCACYLFSPGCRQCSDRQAHKLRKSRCCTPHAEDETVALTDKKPPPNGR